jgi:predicted unusual protein kinase regulating ubiquinone biosynthesis (AarF/ABC1/UbiB family)
VVKAIYPEIRRYLVADLANARRAAQQITKLMDIPVKGTIDSIMDEQVDSFPRELDLRIEARHLRKSRLFFHRHGIASKIAIPVVVDELSSSSVLTQTFLPGKTLSSVDRDDPAVKAKAVQAVVDIAMGIGMTMFRERFFHSDPHPGNIMLLGDACKPGLIDFGQCTGLTKEQLRTVCHVVILLRTRSPSLIDKALAMGDGDFEFNTDDPELKMALMYYFFDSSTTGSGAVRPEAMEFLKDAIQHNPSIMPVLTDTPREMIFYGRVCGTLRKSFELLDADVSVISLWYLEAKKALRAINHAAPDNISSALLLLPDDPDGLVYIVERLPTWTTNAIKAASSFGDKIADLAGETAASRVVPEAFVAADVAAVVGLQRKLFAASVLLAGVYLFAEPLVRGFAALVGAACFGFVAAAVAGVKPPSLSKIKGPLHLLFPDQALFAPPKKDAAAPPSF